MARRRRDQDERPRQMPPWLAELWQLVGRDPPDDPRDDREELERWLTEVRGRLAELHRRFQAWRQSLATADEDEPASAA